MKTLFHLIALLGIIFAATSAHAVNDDWVTNFETAKETAAADGKDIFMEFTGSDWCRPCIKLEEEVFSDPEFAAAEDFILLRIDVPQNKSKQSKDLQEQNANLTEAYHVTGFPTMLLMDASGKPYAKLTGFQDGGVAKFNEKLKTLLAQKTARDTAMEKYNAEGATNDEKADSLIEAFKAIPGVAPNLYYAEEFAQLKRLRPGAELAFLEIPEPERNRRAHIAELERQVAAGELEGEKLQQARFTLLRTKEFKTVVEKIAALEEIAAIKAGTRVQRSALSVSNGLRYYSEAKANPISGWLNNFDEAKQKADAEGKNVIVVALSARESYSNAFKSNVLAKLQFEGSDNFVMTCLEFPGRLSNTEEFAEHDEMLRESRASLAIQRCPLILLTDSTGKPYARFIEFGEDERSTAESLSARISKMAEQKTKRDEAFAAAAATDDKSVKAEKIVEAFEAMPGVQPFLYPEELEQLKKLQPDAWLLKDRATVSREFSKVERELTIKRQKRRIVDENLQGEKLQIARGLMVIQSRYKTIEEEIAAWEAVVAIDPDTKHGKLYQTGVDRLRESLESGSEK